MFDNVNSVNTISSTLVLHRKSKDRNRTFGFWILAAMVVIAFEIKLGFCSTTTASESSTVIGMSFLLLDLKLSRFIAAKPLKACDKYFEVTYFATLNFIRMTYLCYRARQN